MDALRRWYNSLEQHERLLVTGAGALLAVVLCVALLVGLHGAVSTRVARVERKQQDLVWLRSVAPTVQSLSSARPGLPGESLVVLIDRTARQAGLAGALTSQTPNGEDGMRVGLSDANFDNLIVWLGVLQQQYGIGVESASIDRTEKSGIVNASLVLTRGGRT